MKKFSVIIPCYHSEEFVKDAIQSVKAQTFDNYELLVMCETWDVATIQAVKECGVDPKVGDFNSSGAARNAGIDLSEGEYILFLDSDDRFYGCRVFETLDKFLRFPTDVLSFGFFFGIYGYTPVLGNNGSMYPNVWSRAWRRQFIGDTRFPNTSRDEDVAFCTEMFNKKEDMVHRMTDLPFVEYTYPREGSRMNEKELENGC